MTLSKNQRRLAWVLGSLALILILLPEAIRFGGQYTLKELGAESAQIDDVDLNLFAGTVAIEGVAITYDQQETVKLGSLAVDIDMFALFSQRVLVEQVSLNALTANVYEKEGNWVVGIPLPQSSEEEELDTTGEETELAWRFGLNTIDLKDLSVNARYQADTFKLQLNELFAEKLLMWQPNDISSMKLDGKFNDANFAFSGGVKPFAESRSFDLDIKLDALNLAFINSFLPEIVENLAATLTIDTHIDVMLKQDGGIGVQQKGSIALVLDDVSIPDVAVSAKDIRWEGDVSAEIPNGAEPIVKAVGIASLKGVDSHYAPLKVKAGVSSFKWDGEVALDTKDINNSLASKGSVELNGLAVLDQQEQIQLANWDTLTLTHLALNGFDDITLQSIRLFELEALKKADQQPIASLGNLTVKNIALKAQNDLAIDEITLSDVNGALERNPSGKVETLESWLASFNTRLESMNKASGEPSEAEQVAAAEQEQADETFSFAVGSIQIVGSNQLIFVDKGIQPEIKHPVTINAFSIGEINSKAKSQLAPLDINISLYEHGLLKAVGKVSPLQSPEKMNADIKLDLKGIELPELSAYIEPALGYRANSGQLNVAGKATIKEGQLDSETNVKVLRVDFKAMDEELIKKLGTHLTMPVDTALNIITDSDDTLEIDIPVEGDLSNPNIRINSIIGGAVAQAVQNTAMTYFKYAVQPFGAIMLVSETIGDMHMQAKFEDVRFVPGTSQMVAEQAGYLEKVAGMIKEKDGFSVLVCVVVTDQDFTARNPPKVLAEGEKLEWDDAAKALAKSRIDLIKHQLIKQHGLGPDRVQACQPQLKKGKPRAVMGI